MRKYTIDDVARRAGVGIGTVSRVLNNHSEVKDSTRKLVLQAMKELNYVPNPHARRIAGGRSYTVSVLLPVVSSEFYLRLLDSMESVFHEQRYDLAIFPLLDLSRLERFLSSRTLAYQTDGLVMASYNLAEHFARDAWPTRQPAVLVDAYSPDFDCAYVDNTFGGRLAAELAVRCGGEIRAIWLNTEVEQMFTSLVFRDRRKSFSEEIAATGREIAQNYYCSLDAQAARVVAARLLSEARLPCTVFAAADLLANAILEEAGARGVRVGQELKVIGFDDQPWAAGRGLSTIRQPVEAMGRACAELLLSRLDGHGGPPRARRFTPMLVERASTGGER